MTYIAEYARTGRSSCHWLECEDAPIEEGELRIGKGAKQTVWYHVDCFFKFLVALGPKNLKLKSWEDFRIDRDAVKEEDKQLLNDKLEQCHKEKANKKRKAEEDINDRFAKIAKLDLPPLFTDNLIELLCKFNNKDLLTASLVNKQFNSIARKLLFTRKVKVTHKKFYKTTKKQMPFVMQLRKLSFENCNIATEFRDDNFTQLLAQLTNLQEIKFPRDGSFVLPAIKTLTQLTSLHLQLQNMAYDVTRANEISEQMSFDMFKELKDLTLEHVPKAIILKSTTLPRQLTSLSLLFANIDSLRVFTNLEHLEFVVYSQEMTHMVNLISTEAFELPHLTSMTVCSSSIDFSKWTRLKTLKYRDAYGLPCLLPPNLERLSTVLPNGAFSHLPSTLPATLKHLSVGRLRKYVDPEKLETFYSILRALDERCNVNLLCSEFVDVPEDIIARPNLTIDMETSSYGNFSWSDMMKFFSGPLPERLHITFKSWRNCRYKPKLLEELKLLETKTRLLVDYQG